METTIFFFYNKIKRKEAYMKKLSILQKLTLSYTLIVLIVMILTGLFIFPIELKTLNKNLESNISHTASILSSDPEIIDGLSKGTFDSSLIKRLDIIFSGTTKDINYLVISNTNGIRLYHQNHFYIGKKFTGGDYEKILTGAKPYITIRQGNEDVQKRAFHAIQNKKGNIIGFLMVSASLSTIHQQKRQLITGFLLIFLLIFCVGVVIAYIIARNIRKSLLGFEPGTFADMYLQREEILDNLDELILAVDKNQQLLYQNKTSETMEDAKSFFSNTALTGLIEEGFHTGKSLFGRILEISGASLLVNLIPLPEPGKPEAVLLIMRDRTEITSLAQQLTGTNHVIDALRANTHEYMNKLHVISGLLQIGSIDEAIEFISDVSTDIESGYQTIVRQIRNRTIAALILGKRNRAKELDIDFTLRKDSSLEEHNPYLSTKELVTIVGNLIENAFDATKNMPGIRQVELFITSNEHGLTITTDDTGHGMTEQQIERIYEGQYTTKGEGHGIGLRLIQEIMKKHEGFLDIVSEPEAGTSFTISINKRRKNYD